MLAVLWSLAVPPLSGSSSLQVQLSPATLSPAVGVFCFAAISHELGDVPLLLNILNASDDAGFSGCDAWRLYSNVSYVPQLSEHRRCDKCVEKAIDGPMEVSYSKGHASHLLLPLATASNQPIFRQVWRHIFATAAHAQWNWTVKVDTDAVFMASRLRTFLGAPPGAVYGLQVNGQFHGPIEVFSSQFVDVLAAHFDECVAMGQSDDLKEYGEDEWLRACAVDLGVRQKLAQHVMMPLLLDDKRSAL